MKSCKIALAQINPTLGNLAYNKNKILIYYESKFKIKCERRFEIDQKNIVVAFNSKNCF